MLGDHTYELLRRYAAVVHAVPGATLTITADDDPVLIVGHGLAEPADGVRTCSPCGFRTAVGRAHQLHATGRQMSLLGLGPEANLEIRLDPGSAGDVVDGDVVLAWISDRLVAMTATTLPPSAAQDALLDGGIDIAQMCCHEDQLLGASLLHLDVPVSDPAESGELLDLLGRARDACAVAELLDSIVTADAAG